MRRVQKDQDSPKKWPAFLHMITKGKAVKKEVDIQATDPIHSTKIHLQRIPSKL